MAAAFLTTKKPPPPALKATLPPPAVDSISDKKISSMDKYFNLKAHFS